MTNDTATQQVPEKYRLAPLEGQVVEQLPTIYTRFEQLEELREAIDTADVLIEIGQQFRVITDVEQRDKALEYVARLRKHVSTLDNARLSATQGCRDIVAGFNRGTKTRTDPMGLLNSEVTTAIVDFNAELKRQAEAEERARRQAEEARLKAEAEERDRIAAEAGLDAPAPPAAAEESVEPAPPAPPPLAVETRRMTGSHGSTGAEIQTWHWEVVDISQVPESFLVPPEDRVQKSTLNALARSQKEKAAVPGIKFYATTGLSTRVAK